MSTFNGTFVCKNCGTQCNFQILESPEHSYSEAGCSIGILRKPQNCHVLSKSLENNVRTVCVRCDNCNHKQLLKYGTEGKC